MLRSESLTLYVDVLGQGSQRGEIVCSCPLCDVNVTVANECGDVTYAVICDECFDVDPTGACVVAVTVR